MRILLVEDEIEMARALASVLQQHGNIVDHVTTIELGEEAVRSDVHDLILIDRNLPDGDGVTLLRSMRGRGITLPVIMLTAHNEPTDRISGLDEGADDYIGKPFLADELMARIRAASRRASSYSANIVGEGNVKLDLNTLEVSVADIVIAFPRRETLLLKSLLRRAGKTVLRRSLEEAVYGYDDEIQSNALDRHVSSLRKRLSDAKADIEIHSIRGLGYLLREIE